MRKTEARHLHVDDTVFLAGGERCTVVAEPHEAAGAVVVEVAPWTGGCIDVRHDEIEH